MHHHQPPELTVDPNAVVVPPINAGSSTNLVPPSDYWIEPIVLDADLNGKTVKAVVGNRYGDRRKGNTTWV